MKLICPKCNRIAESNIILKYIETECCVCGSIMVKEKSELGIKHNVAVVVSQSTEKNIESINEKKIVASKNVTQVLKKIIFEPGVELVDELEKTKRKIISRPRISRLKLVVPLIFAALVAFGLYFVNRLHFDEVKFKVPEKNITYLHFSLDSTQLYVLTKSGFLTTYDIKEQIPKSKKIVNPDLEIYVTDFLTNETYIAKPGMNNSIKIRSKSLNFNMEPVLERTFTEHKAQLTYIEFLPGMPILLSMDETYEIRLYDFLNDKILYKAKLPDNPFGEEVTCWATNFFHTNVGMNIRFALGYKDGRIAISSIMNLGVPFEIQTSQSSITAIAFGPHPSIIAYGTANGEIGIIQIDTAANKYNTQIDFKGCDSAVTSLAFSPDKRMLAAGELDGKVSLWMFSALEKGTKKQKPYRKMKAHKKDVSFITFSITGDIVATAGKDGYVRIWFVGM